MPCDMVSYGKLSAAFFCFALEYNVAPQAMPEMLHDDVPTAANWSQHSLRH